MDNIEKLINDQEYLLSLKGAIMPFGKYKDIPLLDIPEEYYIWLKYKGFPDGELGRKLAIIYEIKLNGLEFLFDKL